MFFQIKKIDRLGEVSIFLEDGAQRFREKRADSLFLPRGNQNQFF